MISQLRMRLMHFFPKRCLLCKRIIEDDIYLCEPCFSKMSWFEKINSCRICGIELFEGQESCGECLTSPPYFERTYAVWKYDALSRLFIQHLKFREDFGSLPFLVNALYKMIQNRYQTESLPEVILPVPLYFSRLLERGFNQTHEIGKSLAKALRISFDYQVLRKVKSTKAQSMLPFAERRLNLKSAFMIRKKKPYRRVALLDDVMTTGATVSEVSKILKQAGVEEIHVWVLARVLR